MTPIVLIAIMLVLALVLCVLMVNIVRQLRSRDRKPEIGKGKPQLVPPAHTEPTEVDQQEPYQDERLPRVIGRKRQLKALSDGGGDQSVAQELLDSGAYASCERRLEQSFDAYSLGRVSLETYETMVRAEGERAKRLRSEFRAEELAGIMSAEALDDFRKEIETIEIAVQWCLDWAEDFRINASARSGPSATGEN